MGKPITFTIGKTNVLPSDLEWSVREHLPASMECVSATPSQGTCARSDGSNVVQCAPGIIPSGGGSPSTHRDPDGAGGDNYATDNG